MSDYICQLRAVDSVTFKFKPSNKARYDSKIRSIIPIKQRTFSIRLCNRLFKGEVVGGSRFAITLICENEITLKVMKGFPTGDGTPAIHIILHQKTCYENLQATYGELVNWIITDFGEGRFWWGNVDICTHVEGYNFDLVEDHDRFLGAYHQKSGFIRVEEDYKTTFTGFRVGSDDSETIIARIYDKLQKLKRRNKNWKEYLDPRPYYQYPSQCIRPWVVEFSFREKWLKEKGILSGIDLWSELPSMWQYGTQTYLIHTVSKSDRKIPSDFWRWVSSLWGEGVELQKRIPALPKSNKDEKIKSFNHIRSKVTELMNEIPQYQQELYGHALIKHISKITNTHQVD